MDGHCRGDLSIKNVDRVAEILIAGAKGYLEPADPELRSEADDRAQFVCSLLPLTLSKRP
jgi:hypothetical protein